MLKTFLSNYILSKVDINRAKEFIGNAPILNIFYKMGSQLLIDYKFPTHIFIETTRACNLKCKSCPRDLGNAKIGNMKFEVFKKIIDEASSFGARNFCLHIFGEPLLHPQIVEMARYIKSQNPKHSILLTTNGYFLDESKAEGLIRAGTDKIAISFFSLKDDVSGILTGDCDIQKVINNVRVAAELRRRLGGKTRLFIRYLMCEENKGELNDFRSLAKKIGVSLEIRKTHNYSGVIEDNYTSKFAAKYRYPCYHLWFSPAITWDGKVLLCCNDWNYCELLGDINEKTLLEVWQSDRLKQLRKFHLMGHYNKIPLCEKCNVWMLYPDIFFVFQKTNEKGTD